MVLAVALETRRLLEAAGLAVAMTREAGDVSVSNGERARFANESGARLCVKVHCDGVRRGLRGLSRLKRGVMTLHPASDCVADTAIVAPSVAAAATLQARVHAASGLRDRGVHSRRDLTGLNWSLVPVVLLEAGNLTYPPEERLLASSSFQGRLAAGIAAGITEVLGR